MKFLSVIIHIGATAATVIPGLPTEKGQSLTITPEQAHENAMVNHPSEWILHSDDIDDYIAKNPDSNHTIYLKDQHAFVDMRTVVLEPKALNARENGGCISPAKYTKTYTKQTGQWWDSWYPASSCLYTGYSDGGGSQAISTTKSTTITTTAALDWKIIADVLSANLGIWVAQGWSESRTYTCNVQANSVVQVWAQQYLAWGWFWSQQCYSNSACGGCAGEYVNGGATAPASAPNGQKVNYGCSTGYDKVQC